MMGCESEKTGARRCGKNSTFVPLISQEFWPAFRIPDRILAWHLIFFSPRFFKKKSKIKAPYPVFNP
jgi:hypothetical protein